jgi:hypothetical protein
VVNAMFYDGEEPVAFEYNGGPVKIGKAKKK